MSNTLATKRIYWATTLLFSAAMAFSAVSYLTDENMARAFVHLGFPSYFRVELAFAKMLGVAALLAPVPSIVKHWAYAGFGITLVSAIIAHSSSGDPATVVMIPGIMGIVYAASYACYLRLR